MAQTQSIGVHSVALPPLTMDHASDTLAGQTLRQMEAVSASVAQIHEQLLEFQDFRKMLGRIERSIDLLRSGDLGSASKSVDVLRRRKMSGASAASRSDVKESMIKLGERERSHSNLSESASRTPSMHKIIDVLEEHTARVLQQQHRRKASKGISERSEEPLQADQPLADVIGLHQPSNSPPSSRSGPPKAVSYQASASMSCVSILSLRHPDSVDAAQPADKIETVRTYRRKSLDELQATHDAAITATVANGLACDSLKLTTSNPRCISLVGESALPHLGWLLLSFVGILDLYEGSRWRVLARCILAMQIMIICGASFVLSLWRGGVQEIEPLISTVLYLLGALLATAAENDYLEEWRKLSKLRLLQILSIFVLMLGSRAAALLFTVQPSYGKLMQIPEQDAATIVTFTVMAACYCTACYCTLHITAGLELAVDSFAVRCFNTSNIDAAIVEWNLVQATLRRTSCKLSEFLVVMASSCIISLILFAYQVFSLNLSDSYYTALDVVLWLGWLYPPALLFLYSLSSAAAVTEKVDRLAPLVNSWTFDERDILDESRHYMVQYILQSRAGFYTKGVRLTASNVQKICYYFAAGSFGLLANFWQQ